MGEKSKILIIGGTGYIGKFIVAASAKSGHPTFALLREATIDDPAKSQLIQDFRNFGVTIIKVLFTFYFSNFKFYFHLPIVGYFMCLAYFEFFF